jgi:hypothetical protein
MRRFSFLIAATVLVGLCWGGVAELVDTLGIQVWMETRLEASDIAQRATQTDQDR